MEELLFVVVVLPAAAGIELKKMRAAPLGEGAPFLGDRVECMRRHSCRHGGAGSQRSWRRGIVWSGTRTSNDRPLTGSLRPRHISESLDIIILLPGTRAGAALVGDGFRLLVAEERAPCSTPQKLTRPDGEIRAGRVDRRRGSGGVSAPRTRARARSLRNIPALQKSISLPEGVYLKGIGNGIGALTEPPTLFTTIAGTTDHLVASITAPNAGVTPFVGIIARRRRFSKEAAGEGNTA